MATGIRTDDRWERLAPISGIVFVLAVLGIFFGIPEAPDDATSGQLRTFYEQNEVRLTIIPFFLGAIAAVSLMWFAGSLRSALLQAEPPPGRLSSLAFAGGVASASLLLAAASAFTAPAAAVAFAEDFTLEVGTVDIVESMGFALFLYFLIAGGVMITAASLLALRSHLWPAWWSWVGFLFALALLVNVFYFFGFFALLLWVLVVSIQLIRGLGRPGRPAMGANVG